MKILVAVSGNERADALERTLRSSGAEVVESLPAVDGPVIVLNPGDVLLPGRVERDVASAPVVSPFYWITMGGSTFGLEPSCGAPIPAGAVTATSTRDYRRGPGGWEFVGEASWLETPLTKVAVRDGLRAVARLRARIDRRFAEADPERATAEHPEIWQDRLLWTPAVEKAFLARARASDPKTAHALALSVITYLGPKPEAVEIACAAADAMGFPTWGRAFRWSLR